MYKNYFIIFIKIMEIKFMKPLEKNIPSTNDKLKEKDKDLILKPGLKL